MPSITSLSGYTLNNLGPLTTTFTPPTSCATSALNVLLAASSNPTSFRWSVDCDEILQVLDCLPSGSVQRTMTGSDGALDLEILHYMSPGVICPSGWKTMGIAARSGDKSPSLSGVFEAVSTGPPHNYKGAVGLNVIAAALDPSETAIACCPSTMLALPNGACFSPLPSYSVTAGCAARVVHDDDESSDGDSYGLDASLSTYTTTFEPKETSSYIGVETMPGLVMVHKPSNTGATPSSGAALHPAGRSWDGIGSLVGLISTAFAIGAAMVLL